jgi:hypothetical protein
VAEYLVKQTLAKIKTHQGYEDIFGLNGFYPYRRMDLSKEMLPAFQLFEDADSFNPLELTGKLTNWIIMPPGLKQAEAATVLRSIGKTTCELFQTAQWLITTEEGEIDYSVPGLADFAQTGRVNWNAVYMTPEGEEAPSIEISVDYALDYRTWAKYLCELQPEGRERDPFADSIVELRLIAATIKAYDDVQSVVDGDDPVTEIGLNTDPTT